MTIGESETISIHPYGPELAYLDHQITGTGDEYFDVLQEWVGIALQHPDGSSTHLCTE